jgi:hypothetical protein
LNPEPEDAAKIKRKIEEGLPEDSGPRAALQNQPSQPSQPETAAPGPAQPQAGN